MTVKRFSTILISALAFLAGAISAAAQNADDILGEYFSKQGADEYKARISRNADGSYKGQITWVSNPIDPATGKTALDVKNPDKSLRSTPCDRIVLFNGVKFNSAKKIWDGAKIYDPQRGIKANLSIKKNADGNLSIRGSLMGIGETVIWKRL